MRRFDPARFGPILIIAGNLAVAIVFMQAIIIGVFPFSHHWIIPGLAARYLVVDSDCRVDGE